jgi:hypothetical protein
MAGDEPVRRIAVAVLAPALGAPSCRRNRLN